MEVVQCPHCGEDGIGVSKVPKDVIVVVPCPSCGEWVVLFRRKAIALDRRLLEEGSHQERVGHLAEIIAQFLEPGILSSLEREQVARSERMQAAREDDSGEEAPDKPISQSEYEHFVEVDLKRLDEPGYFRKHFG